MRTVDLFAGAGGMSLGFERAGFNIVGAFEVWEAAVKVHRDNFTHEVYETDLSNVETAAAQIKELSPEAIIGGPPCQDFSDAGNRTEGDRANLTRCYAKIIAKISPTVFVMENVGRAQKSAAYRDARVIFKSCGYGLTEVVLDASLCGAPQKRKRFFCIGIAGRADGALESVINERLSTEPLTVREYMGEELEIQNYYVHPRTYARRGIFSIDEPAPTMRGQNRPLPGNYKKHPRDAAEPQGVRALSSSERARIQTFPRGFKWSGTKQTVEQVIGNAVPPNLAEFVGRCILDYLKEARP